MSAIETLIVWENLEIERYVLRNNSTGEETVVHLNEEEAKNPAHFHDKETGAELQITESMSMVEWLATNYKELGTTLEFVTDRSQEGAQFTKGFGGIGGLLRWRVDFVQMDEFINAGEGEEEEDDFSDDEGAEDFADFM